MQIDIQNLSMSYPTGKQALRDVTFKLESPNLIGLLGPNGAGKSTLIKLLVAGLLPTSGSIYVDKKPLLKNENYLKANLGYLPQSFGLYNELTVYEFLDYIASLKGISRIKQEIDRALISTNLEEKRKSKIHTLSGGQKQRVGIAQAILGNPQFLIFDEPTVGLDPEERINFRNLFSKMAQNKLVLLSTHINEDIQSVCNQVIVINNGSILFLGTPSELIKNAQGHIGVLEEKHCLNTDNFQITGRHNTSNGVICRVVASDLPCFAQVVEPSLEDAYLYCISKEAVR